MPHRSLQRIIFAPDAPLREVVARLSAEQTKPDGLPGGLALICGAGGKLLGIATDGDLRRALAPGLTLDAPVSSIMNRTPVVVPEHVPLRERAGFIREALRQKGSSKKYVEKAIVVDDKGVPVDVLTTYDIWQTADARQKRVGIVGLGYVGLTLALTLADEGFTVFGLETDKKIIKSITAGKPHFHEAGLAELLQKHLRKNFHLVPDFRGPRATDVYVVCVGTPLKKDGTPDSSHLEAAAREVGATLKRNDTVILRSTVAVGTTREIVVPILEKESGLSAGSEFLVAFAPERTVEGKALEELRALPQVVGGLNRASAESASAIFSFLTRSIVTLDSLEEAEMVKLVNNTYRETSFSLANEIALIAEKWGVAGSKVIRAANFGYERSRVPEPSPGIGGYCLTKDPQIFAASAARKGYRPALIASGSAVNARMRDAIVRATLGFLKKNKIPPARAKVLIAGFAFKGVPATSDMRGSVGVEMVRALRARGIRAVLGFDPAVLRTNIKDVGALPVSSLNAGIARADALLIMNNNPAFAETDIKTSIRNRKKPLFIFDGWNVLHEQKLDAVPRLEYRIL